jgi:hypothetical protein
MSDCTWRYMGRAMARWGTLKWMPLAEVSCPAKRNTKELPMTSSLDRISIYRIADLESGGASSDTLIIRPTNH